jgi:hypothetical protein
VAFHATACDPSPHGGGPARRSSSRRRRPPCPPCLPRCSPLDRLPLPLRCGPVRTGEYTAMPKVANRYVSVSGEIAHAPVSRRPPISLPTSVARTRMYTFAFSLGFFHRSRTIFCRLRAQPQTLRFATVASLLACRVDWRLNSTLVREQPNLWTRQEECAMGDGRRRQGTHGCVLGGVGVAGAGSAALHKGGALEYGAGGCRKGCP